MGRASGKLVAALLITALLVAAGLLPASAADQVPLKGRGAGSFVFNESQSGLFLGGIGNFTHLGKSTTSGTMAFLGLAACEGGFLIHDDETLTSIDTGEQISFAIDDEACPTATPGVFQIEATFTVTGGTGRFAGASGQGTVVCLGDFNIGANTFSFTMKGTISRPNSD